MSLIFQHEIRPGDTIKVTSQGGGVLVERTGTVANRPLSHGVLRTEEQSVLWDGGWAGQYSFDLIDRPKPPLPLKEGTVIIVQDLPVETGPVTLIRRDSQRTGRWEYLNGQGYYSTEQVQNRSWKLAKVVEA